MDDRRWATVVIAAGVIAAAIIAALAWRASRPRRVVACALGEALASKRLTDFPGSEVDAAISADGNRVAFLADRDSVFDAFVTRVGGGQFVNLTNGRLQLYNEDVRNIGFTGDSAHVGPRRRMITSPASI